MRFTIDAQPVPVRRFRLPAHEHATAPAPPPADKPLRAPVWGAGVARQTHKRPVEAQTPKRTAKRPAEAQMAAGGLYTVSAPIAARKGRTVLEFTAASEYQMAGFMGTIQLQINRDSVDLTRIGLGLCPLAVDHDTSRLMGRVVEATIYAGRLDMLAEISDTPTATNAMDEIDDLTRGGFSPGFIIEKTETLSEGDRGYDPDQMFQIVVTRFEIYEVSSTAIPRSPDARLKGVASMENVISLDDAITGAPEIVHREDLIGLSLAAGRKALQGGTGTDRQRSKLSEFFELYEVGLENGLGRDVAAQAAKRLVDGQAA